MNALSRRTEILFDLARYDDGLKDSDRALALDAHRYGLRLARAQLQFARGEKEDAFALLHAEAKDGGSHLDWAALTHLGFVGLRTGDFELARTLLSKAATLVPAQSVAQRYVVHLWIEERVAEGLIQEVDQLVDQHRGLPAHPRGHLFEVKHLLRKGRADEALRLVETISSPRGPEAEDLRAYALMDLGRGRQVYDEWRAAPQTDGRADERVLEVLHALASVSDLDTARAVARAAVPFGATRAGLRWQALVDAYAGRALEAHAALNRVGSHLFMDEIFSRARAHALLGEHEEALRWLQEAADRGVKPLGRTWPWAAFQGMATDPRFVALRERMTLR